MSPDELRALADRVRYAATLLMRPGMPSSYWDACNRAADYLRLQAHTHPAQAEPKREPLSEEHKCCAAMRKGGRHGNPIND